MTGVLFFFNDTATTGIYTLSLHGALPIWSGPPGLRDGLRLPAPSPRLLPRRAEDGCARPQDRARDRKSTRLNSSHAHISYAAFCLKKLTAPPPFPPTGPRSCGSAEYHPAL